MTAATAHEPLLDVEDLRVSFDTIDGAVQAVRGVTFQVGHGGSLGIVGESGSGKSVSTQAILGLLNGAHVSGAARFEGRDLLQMKDSELRKVRGAGIAVVFQDPLTSLHPLHRVGWQIVEVIRAHTDMSKKAARARAVELLDWVGIPSPRERADHYPYQFSGGMRQRVMIAMALALNPRILIADEPTTALDVTVQAQILALIKRIQREFDTALVMITHDLGVITEVTEDVMVMYAGQPVEYASNRTLHYEPHHPYTAGLIECLPRGTSATVSLKPIPGTPPSLLNVPAGCAFHPRCSFAMDLCRTQAPPLRKVAGGTGHQSACWLPTDLVGVGQEASDRRAAAARTPMAVGDGGAER
jgi:oligopeptide/dipeptide ABC transporter ATP-binding protein